jgi:hypothetical protein
MESFNGSTTAQEVATAFAADITSKTSELLED